MWVDLEIENNEGNLAGLVAAENLPERLESTAKDPETLWKDYLTIFLTLSESDRADYWAFFYQCWNLLPFSHALKLKNLGLLLTKKFPPTENFVPPDMNKMRYTSVLTRQSGMFNAWKLLCELSDTTNFPIRLSPMACELELLTGQNIKVDRKRRLQNLRITNHVLEVLRKPVDV